MNPVAGADPMFPGFGPNGAGAANAGNPQVPNSLPGFENMPNTTEMLTLLRVWVYRLE